VFIKHKLIAIHQVSPAFLLFIQLRKALIIDTAQLVYKTLNRTRSLKTRERDIKCHNSFAMYKPGQDVMNILRSVSIN